MGILFSFIRFFSRFYWIKKKLIQNSKQYFFKYHILKIVEEINDVPIYKEDFLTLKDAINSEAFKNGLIEFFLQPNDYIINSKDIAVAISMGAFAHSNERHCINSNIIDAAFYLTNQIKKRIILDENLKYIFSELGKDIKQIGHKYSRDEVEVIFSDKRLIFKNYFMLFNSPYYTEKIRIYYPGQNKTWLEWKEDDSLEISINERDIPTGFFLIGFDYTSSKLGKLEFAIRKTDKEFFNPTDRRKGKTIWAQ